MALLTDEHSASIRTGILKLRRCIPCAAAGPGLLAGLTLLLHACAVSEVNPEVFSDYDRGTSFAGYQTFAWQSADPMVVASPRPITAEGRRIALARTVSGLEAKGFRHVKRDANPDLEVVVVFGSRDGLKLNNYPGRWGRSYVELRDAPQGGIGIELFKGGTEQLLWTGWATTGLTEEVYANRDDVIEELINKVLAEFPPP